MAEVVTQAMINTKISFQSKNPADDVVWTGTVLALMTYEAAKSYGDIVAYRGAVAIADPTIDTVENLNYFLLRLDEVDGQPRKIFASEFILDGSLEAIDQRVIVVLHVYDLSTNDHSAILTPLKANGYPSCSIAGVIG